MWRLAATVVLLFLGSFAAARDEPDARAAAKGANEFAFDLYARLREKPGNLFFSPVSLSQALALAAAGAGGDTAQAFQQTLHLPFDGPRRHAAQAALVSGLVGGDRPRGYRLTVASALWGQDGYPFRKEFLDRTAKSYGAGLQKVDFAGNPEAARGRVNAWAADATKGKIKDLLPAGSVDALTRLVLTNAIHFKGDWESPFKKEKTKEVPFRLANGTTISAATMHQGHTFRYTADEVAQVVELPYGGKDVAMLVLLPRRMSDLTRLEKALGPERLTQWLDGLQPEEVDVALPKFKATSEFALKKELTALDLGKAFSADADFSGLNGGKEELHLSDVFHKAFVDVNEEGTEAAAASAAVVKARGSSDRRTFKADQPFVFLIRDRATGAILFLGRVVDPTK